MLGPGRENDNIRRLDAKVAELARRQHAVLGLGQLRGLGLEARAVQHRAVAARFHRVHRGVYSLVPPPLLTYRGRLMAAVLACGDGAAVSHHDAAALHDLRPVSGSRIHVTIPRGSTRALTGLTVHRSVTLTPPDVTTVDGIPTTAVARTLLDLAAVLDQPRVERALNQAEVLRVFDLRALEDQLGRNPHHLGRRTLTSALALYQPEATADETALEQRFLALIGAAGLPLPERQAHVDPGDGGPLLRPDFLWRDQRLILETDGRQVHGTRRAFEKDRRRDQRLMLAGWRVVRVTWRQLRDEPQSVVDLVRQLLGV